jgi:hypothetical protein
MVAIFGGVDVVAVGAEVVGQKRSGDLVLVGEQ